MLKCAKQRIMESTQEFIKKQERKNWQSKFKNSERNNKAKQNLNIAHVYIHQSGTTQLNKKHECTSLIMFCGSFLIALNLELH